LTFLNIYLIFFTCAAPCTKNNELLIDVSYHLILFIHAELTDLDLHIIVLFIHIKDRHMKSKGHLYIYPSGIQQNKILIT
jgi:hypothetical protein